LVGKKGKKKKKSFFLLEGRSGNLASTFSSSPAIFNGKAKNTKFVNIDKKVSRGKLAFIFLGFAEEMLFVLCNFML
jgi:hypothetical protein